MSTRRTFLMGSLACSKISDDPDFDMRLLEINQPEIAPPAPDTRDVMEDVVPGEDTRPANMARAGYQPALSYPARTKRVPDPNGQGIHFIVPVSLLSALR